MSRQTILKKLLKPLQGKGLGKIPGARQAYRFFFSKVLGKGLVLAEVQGSKMYLDLSDRYVSIGLFLDSNYEKGTSDLFKKLLKPGMVVLDVGAYIGYYTLIAAKIVGDKGKVFVFEPDPNNYELLLKNIQINSYQNVVAVNKAVSNQAGKGELFLSSENRGDHRIYNSLDSRPAIEIELISLDEFFKNQEHPIDLIKMDIQGAEMAALLGMNKILERNPNLKMIIEFWPFGLEKFGYSLAEFLNHIQNLSYRLQLITDEGLEAIEKDALIKLCEKQEFVNLYLEK